MKVDRHQASSYPLRLPDEIKAEVEASALRNGRSINAEITRRLQAVEAATSGALPVPLRDYFAAKALAAMLGNPNKEGANCGANGVQVFAGYAYEYADAMLKARQGGAS